MLGKYQRVNPPEVSRAQVPTNQSPQFYPQQNLAPQNETQTNWLPQFFSNTNFQSNWATPLYSKLQVHTWISMVIWIPFIWSSFQPSQPSSPTPFVLCKISGNISVCAGCRNKYHKNPCNEQYLSFYFYWHRHYSKAKNALIYTEQKKNLLEHSRHDLSKKQEPSRN